MFLFTIPRVSFKAILVAVLVGVFSHLALAWDLWAVTSQDFSDGVDHDRFRILVVRDVDTQPIQEFVAHYDPVPGTMDYYGYKNALGDIAFAPNGELYGVAVTLGEPSRLYRLIPGAASYSLEYLGDLPFQWGTSLYFDPSGRQAYVGGGLESWWPYEWSHGLYVFYNYDPSTAILWKDMRDDPSSPNGGTSMGYAHHDGYLYAFWGPGHWNKHITYLLRITEDENGNYVSHEIVDDVESNGLPDGAYDIISDGVNLYALGPNAFYRIENYQANGPLRFVKLFDFQLLEDESVNGITAQWADLELSLEARPTDEGPVGAFELVIRIENKGPYPAERVRAKVPLPGTVNLESQRTTQGTYDPATGTWEVGTLAVHGQAQLRLILSSSLAGPFNFEAWVTNSSALDPDSSPAGDRSFDDWRDGLPDDDEATIMYTPTADLQLSKAVRPERAGPGDTVKFTLTLSNEGPSGATGIEVRDSLPDGYSYVSARASRGSYDPDRGVWTVEALESNATATLELTATVKPRGERKNVAEVVAALQYDPDSTPGNGDASEDDYAEAAIVYLPEADLALTKTASPQPVAPGDQVTFTLTLENLGPNDASGVQVQDLLPSGYQYISDDGKGAYDPSTGIWTVGGLASGERKTLVINALVNSSGEYTNRATVTAQDPTDPSADNNEASLRPDLAPQVSDDEISTEEDTPTKIFVLNNDRSPDGWGSLEVATAPQHGTAFVDDNGTPDNSSDDVIRYIPEENFNGEDTFSYRVCDLDGDCKVATVRVRVQPVNDPPVATDDLFVTKEDTSVSGNVITEDHGNGVDYDVDGDSLTLVAFTVDGSRYEPGTAVSLSEGKLYIAQDGSLVFQPALNYHGTLPEAITYSISDGHGATASASVRITVSSVNDAPVVQDDRVTTPEDAPVEGDVLANDHDPDGDPLRVINFSLDVDGDGVLESFSADQRVQIPNVGTFFLKSDGRFEFTPVENYYGPVPPVLYEASDGHGGIGKATLHIEVVPTKADLELFKAVKPSEAGPGEQVTFTVTLVNRGPVTATHVEIIDRLPSGFTYLSHELSEGVFDPQDGRWRIERLESGARATLTLRAVVNPSGSYTNVAEVTAVDQPDPDSVPGDGKGDDYATASVVYRPEADIVLRKSVEPREAGPGDLVTFTLEVQNRGPNVAAGIVVVDPVPDGYRYVSGTAAVMAAGGGTAVALDDRDAPTLRWTIGALGNGERVVLVFKAVVEANGDYQNTARATSDLQDPAEENNAASAGVVYRPEADLVLTKGVTPEEASPGDTVTFNVQLENKGPNVATGIQVSERLPSGYTFVSSHASHGNYDPEIGLWTVDELAVNERALLEITAKVNAQGEFTNTAEVISLDQNDPQAGNDQASAAVHLISPLLIEKHADVKTARLGDLVRYVLRVKNPVGAPIRFDLEDRFDENLIFAGMIEGPSPELEGHVLRWTGLTLKPNGVLELRYRMRVGPNAHGELKNLAIVRPEGPESFASRALAELALKEPLFQRQPNLLLGRVYLDFDADRAFDPKVDVPIPGVRVILANGRQTTTDAEGRYAFRGVEPGVWEVLFDPAGMPARPVAQASGLDRGSYRHRVLVAGVTVLDLPLVAPKGLVHAYRTTQLRYGPVTVEKRMIPLEEQRFRVVLIVKARTRIEGLVIEDPLPGGGRKRFELKDLEGERVFTYDLEAPAYLTDPVLRWGAE